MYNHKNGSEIMDIKNISSKQTKKRKKHRTDFDIPISKVRIIINEYIINATNKEVAEMRYLEQKSFKEIASLLYISETSAKRIAYKCYDIIEAHKDEFE